MFTIIITAGISSSVSLHIELILIVICDGVNSAVIQWLDWSVVVAHERRISTMFTLKFPELVKLPGRGQEIIFHNYPVYCFKARRRSEGTLVTVVTF